MEEDERRHGINEFTAKLTELETDVAVIKSDMARQDTTRRLVWGIAFAAIAQLFAFMYGYGKMTNQLENINLSDVEKNISTLITVLAQHGIELENVRDEQFRMRGQMDEQRLESSRGLARNVEYYKSELGNHDKWVRERFDSYSIRLDNLERESGYVTK